MRIEGTLSPRTASAARRKGSATSSVDFSALLNLGGAAEATAPQATPETSAPPPVSHLISIQEISEQEAAARRLVHEGDLALDRLEDLRHALLMGRLPVETLHRLAISMRLKREQVNDPTLLEIIDDIELRIAVELAKLEQSFTPDAERGEAL